VLNLTTMVFLSIRVPQFACKRFRLTIYSLFPTSGWHNRSRGHMACDKDFGGLPVGNWRGERRLAFVQSYTKVNTHHPRVLFPLAGLCLSLCLISARLFRPACTTVIRSLVTDVIAVVTRRGDKIKILASTSSYTR